jgi:hypothetical protein
VVIWIATSFVWLFTRPARLTDLIPETGPFDARVQALVAQRAVTALDAGVFHGFPGLNEIELHAGR